MKIDRFSAVPATAGRRGERAGATKAGGFTKALASGQAPASAAVSGGGAVAPVDALLALQEVADDAGTGGRARRRGEELLDRLDELRLALLEGSLAPATVQRLAALVAAKRGQVEDRRLAAILDEIELRAAVELAKLGL